jgi:hypothetical protein
MDKIRFSGFPDGTTVSLSTLKDGVSRGPLTVSAWKQAPASNDITFEVYSNHGKGQMFPYGWRGEEAISGPNREIVDGDVIEMVQYGGLGLMIENVQGSNFYIDEEHGHDYRQLFFEIDFGERWDAQFLEHEYLPTQLRTRAASGNTMGAYRGWVAGHVMRGCNLLGEEVLTYDYDHGTGLPPGVMDIPVTVTVSDGLNTTSISFTVRLSHWRRFYTDLSKSTYATTIAEGEVAGGSKFDLRGTYLDSERRGVLYYARDGDFTDAEMGPGIWHVEVPLGRLYARDNGQPNSFCNDRTNSMKSDEGYVIRNTANATQIINGVACDSAGTPITPSSDFPWKDNDPATFCVLLKGGEVWSNIETLNTDFIVPGPNGLVSSWGANGARAIWSGYGLATWAPDDGTMMAGTNLNRYRGITFRHIDYHLSDYTIADETWRRWWNIIPYTNKTAGPGGATGFYPPRGLRYETTTGQLNPGDTITGSETGLKADVLELQDDGRSWFWVRIANVRDSNDNPSNGNFSSGETLTTPGGFTGLAGSDRIEDDHGSYGRLNEKITNDNGSWAQIVHDFDNGDGTGVLLTWQILDQEALQTTSGNVTPFTDGDTLRGLDSGVTVQFDATSTMTDHYGDTVRQDRTRKSPPGFAGGSTRAQGNPGSIGIAFDGCIIRGGRIAFGSVASWLFRSDTLVRDFWDFGSISEIRMLFDSALVITQPSSHPGPWLKDTRAVNSDQKRIWNATKNASPTVPTENTIAHTVHRWEAPHTWGCHKASFWWQGGHTNATSNDDDFLTDPTKGGHQPLLRMQGDAPHLGSNICFADSCFMGGGDSGGAYERRPMEVTPFWWHYENCILWGSGVTKQIGAFLHSKISFRNCEIGWPSFVDLDPVLGGKTADVFVNANDFARHDPSRDNNDAFQDITEVTLPDTNPVMRFENCAFILGAGGIDQTWTIGFDVEQRGAPVPYINCTVDVLDPDSTPGIPALPAGNVAPIPT